MRFSAFLGEKTTMHSFSHSFRTTKNVKDESQHHSDSFSLSYHLSSTIALPWIVKTRERNLTPSSLLSCHTVPFFLFIHTSERNWSSYIHTYTYYYIRSIPIKGEEEGYSKRWFSSFFLSSNTLRRRKSKERIRVKKIFIRAPFIPLGRKVKEGVLNQNRKKGKWWNQFHFTYTFVDGSFSHSFVGN